MMVRDQYPQKVHHRRAEEAGHTVLLELCHIYFAFLFLFFKKNTISSCTAAFSRCFGFSFREILFLRLSSSTRHQGAARVLNEVRTI